MVLWKSREESLTLENKIELKLGEKIVFCGKDAAEKMIDVLQSAGAAKAIFIQIQRV